MPLKYYPIQGILQHGLGRRGHRHVRGLVCADAPEDEQVDVGRVVELLVEHGPSLPFPYSSGIHGSRHRHMRELRIQHAGRPYRVLYGFDPRRAAILLLGGDKTGQDR